MLKKTILLLIFFSLSAWGGQGDAPLSPPELVPASDHDPEHLTMFVTHFFRWWVDNDLRDVITYTKDGKEFYKDKKEIFKQRQILDQEREKTLENSLTPVLWETYKNSVGDVGVDDPIIPWNDSDDTWRDTIFSQIVTLQDHTATLIVSFPLINMGNPPDNAPLQLRILLQTQGGTWRIGGATEITDRDD
jgi:hypothetical protein